VTHSFVDAQPELKQALLRAVGGQLANGGVHTNVKAQFR
jgi:hypothetical protein